jgi:hypothetical protein
MRVPMSSLFDILVFSAIGLTTIVLAFGVYSLLRGGEFARSWSNKLMRMRVAFQALALVLLMVAVWWKSTYGA